MYIRVYISLPRLSIKLPFIDIGGHNAVKYEIID